MTPEELAEIRERLETAYHHEPFGIASAIADVRNLLGQVDHLRECPREKDDLIRTYAALLDYIASLLDYIDDLKQYLREKNEIIKAYAGPKGMTPEDVAFALGRNEDAQSAPNL